MMRRCFLMMGLLAATACAKTTTTPAHTGRVAAASDVDPQAVAVWKLLSETDPDDLDNWSVGSLMRWIEENHDVGYGNLREIAGTRVFLAGPHTDAQLALRNQSSFGYYNPRFVRWVNDEVLPSGPSDPMWTPATIAYRLHLRRYARTFLEVRYKLDANPGFLRQERAAYETFVRAPDGAVDPPVYKYWSFFEDGKPHASVAVAWWLRREIDGTAPIFNETLHTVFETFDPKFLAEVKAKDYKDPRLANVIPH